MGLVVIDPGHGGEERGATGAHGLLEKDVNLNIALKVEQYLLRLGIETALTRTEDQQVSLAERVSLSSDLEADAFVSIHCNSVSDPTVHGAETWVPNTADPRRYGPSQALGYIVHQHLLVTCNARNRGLKYKEQEGEEFYVLRYTLVPACLVEVEFLSHPEGEVRLGSEWFREKAALGIAEGIRRFLEIPAWKGGG